MPEVRFLEVRSGPVPFTVVRTKFVETRGPLV